MTEPKYRHVLQAVYGRCWAIEEATLNVILDLVDFRASGGLRTEAEILARIEAVRGDQGPRDAARRATGTIALIPVYGVLSRRQNMMSETSGGTSIEGLTTEFREALNDDAVDAIVFDVDSPGGTVDGVEELAAEIRAARATKPIVAVANTAACSAAYWLACAAQELVVTPSGTVGSIGIYSAHQDVSKAAEMAGEKTTLISAGKFKVEGNPYEPLSDEARGARQGQVDEFYRMFVHAVARGRGVSMADVRKGYGEGRSMLAKPALAAGMVDRIDTLDNTLRRVARGAVKPMGMGPDTTDETTDDASAAAVSGLPLALDPDAVAAEGEAIVAMAQKHAAARATEGRPLSTADRDRLAALRGQLDGLLEQTPEKPAAVKGSVAPVIDLAAEAVRRGYHLPQA